MSHVVVRPVRFTDHIDAMQEFLQTVGLRPRIASRSGGWVDLVADGGMVALHSAASSATGGLPGQTRLSFEAADVHGLAERLKAADVPDVVVYDEAYGFVLSCRDPLGDEIHVDGKADDLYGYRRVGPETPPDAGLAVVPVRFTDPSEPYGRWLEALGLTLAFSGDVGYPMYAAGEGGHGYVGVRRPYGDDPADLPIVAGAAAAQLTFSTREPIADVAQRLEQSGYATTVTHEDFGSVLTIVDPDGQSVQVHHAPSP